MSEINNQAKLLQATWLAPNNIKAYVTTCKDDFNLALHVNDNEAKVLINRAKLKESLPNTPLWLNQTHSIDVVDWTNIKYDVVNADASISTKSKDVCIVMTADCLPILLSNKTGDFVAAIHAGWRGLDNGIISETIKKLSGYNPNEMVAFIGPAICQKCFEVGKEVLDSFSSKNPSDRQFFMESENHNKYLCNLRKIAEQRLFEAGLKIENISNKNICTKCNTSWFFSYRSSCSTGRFATLIWKE
ncbi:MAG: peptidoglycan editing factor PgeF [Burkholderiales bacterium]|nr:peptidoglycan editing factor PgeF [Burkholderiales bacterium]